MDDLHRRDWVDYARLISGGLFLVAGIAKAFRQIEDVALTLQKMAEASATTFLGPLSRFLSQNVDAVRLLAGLAMAGSGLCFLLNRMLAAAAMVQLLMIACFVVLLFHSGPAIILIDAPFFFVAILVLRRALATASTAALAGESR